MSDDADLDDHVEETIQQMADMHAEHVQTATPLQRRVIATTSAIAEPRTLIFGLVFVVSWVGYNLTARVTGWPVFDPPPFQMLATAASTVALFTTVLILTTQRREEEVSRRRAQLTLQLAALSEQKIAKVISLLEEQRRENPLLSTRVDPQAEAMSTAADPRHVLNRIVETHQRIDEKLSEERHGGGGGGEKSPDEG